MDFARENVLLLYEICGRAEELLLRLLMLKHGSAVFFRTEETVRDPEGPDVYLPVSSEAADAVKRILSESRLYELGRLEKPAEFRGGARIYSFFFAGEERTAEYQGADLEYIAWEKKCPNVSYLFGILSRLGEVLIQEGVPAVCFGPAPKSPGSPLTAMPAAKEFVVCDLRGHGSCRMIGDPERGERLERYVFLNRGDGSFALEIQIGWPGGTGHWDGAGNTFGLPAEWSSGSFGHFLDCLTERFPQERYGFGREELEEVPGLREFLGLTE